MIGPVYPFKGGISHYTGMMVKSLKKEYEVRTISYKMQYPRILFKKEQYDYENDSLKVDDTEYLINTANPFNWGSVVKAIKKINPDYIIFQWWHPYFSPCYIGLMNGLKKYPIIFLCHNVFPHERFPMDKVLTKKVLNHGAGFITHSKTDAENLKSIVQNSNVVTTFLPTYAAFNIAHISPSQARSMLNISAEKKEILFFGLVREYKGLKHIINAMPEIVNYDDKIELMIVGEFGDDKENYLELIENGGVKGNIRLVDKYVPDKEVEKYFAACDIVVLPYESATQSAVVQMAYGFEKPVIVTNVGGLPEVVIDGETGYIVESKNPHQLAEAVIRFYKENKKDEFSENVRKEAYKYSWDRMNEVVLSVTKNIDNIYIYIYISMACFITKTQYVTI